MSTTAVADAIAALLAPHADTNPGQAGRVVDVFPSLGLAGGTAGFSFLLVTPGLCGGSFSVVPRHVGRGGSGPALSGRLSRRRRVQR
ncbi:MAG: hypothetical protein M3Q47_13285 [Actinomycetota bacterium]|nr:hypothetical protein [Actinomycetota bacterium]